MNRLLRAGCFTMLLMVPVSTWGEPPRLTGTAPLGIQRGTAMEVRFEGVGLSGTPRLVAPFGFQLDESASEGAEVKKTEAGRWKVRLTVDARTAVGVYPIRVVTDSGVSNPILFAVGQVPQVTEAEPNNTLQTAQVISTPAVVEGACAGNDQDFFRFKGRKGDRIVVDAVCSRIGSGVDPTIRLVTASGRFVAAADDTPGLFTDGYLTATLPEDGEYLLEFADSRFAGTGRTAYRLLVGAVPYAGEVHPLSLPRGQSTTFELRGGTLSDGRLVTLQTPADPALATFAPAISARSLGDPAWANSDLDVELPVPVPLGAAAGVLEAASPTSELFPTLASPATIFGRLSKPGERDEFTIKAPAGSRHEIRVEAWSLGSALDGQLRVFAKDGRVLGETDDGKSTGRRRGGGGGGGRGQGGPVSTDPAFDLTVPQGQDEVKVMVKDLADRGGVGFTYRLLVEPAKPSFQLSFEDAQVAIPRGGTALIPVTVIRNGENGPIALDLHGLPEGEGGVTVLPGLVPSGQTSGVVGLRATASATSEYQPRELQVVGKGEQGQTVAATKTIVFAEQSISASGFGIGGTIPSYARPFASVMTAVTKPGPLVLEPQPPKVVVPQGGMVELELQVTRSPEEQREPRTYKINALASPTGLSVAEAEVGKADARNTVTVKIQAAANTPVGPLMLALVARDATRPGNNAGRRRGGAATKGGGSPTPPSAANAAAAVMVAVEVVRPSSEK